MEGKVDAAGHGEGVLGQVTFAVGRAEEEARSPKNNNCVRILVVRMVISVRDVEFARGICYS